MMKLAVAFTLIGSSLTFESLPALAGEPAPGLAARLHSFGQGLATRRAVLYHERKMKRAIRDGRTPAMRLVAREAALLPDRDPGTVFKADTGYRDTAGGDHPLVYQVRGLGRDGSLAVKVAMPVSAHVPAAYGSVARYAQENVYGTMFVDAKGRRTRDTIASTGLVTWHDMLLRLQPGRNELSFSPDGSAGVSQYRSGRSVILEWPGP
jgi:hypothetical protein